MSSYFNSVYNYIFGNEEVNVDEGAVAKKVENKIEDKINEHPTCQKCGKPKKCEQNHNTLRVRRATLSKPKQCKAYLISGKKRTGKSTLVKDFILRNGPYREVMLLTNGDDPVLSPLATSIHSYYIDGKSYPHETRQLHPLNNLLRRQKLALSKARRDYTNYNGPTEQTRVAVIFDDTIFIDKNLLKDSYSRQLFQNNISLHIDIFLVTQYPPSLQPNIRSNIDYVMVRENSRPNIKRLYEHFGAFIPSPLDFSSIVTTCTTTNYHFLIIDNNPRTNTQNPEDLLSFYRVDLSQPVPNHEKEVEEITDSFLLL